MRYSLFVVLILTTATVSCVQLETLCEWKYVDFLWKNEEQKELAINSGNYNPRACVLYDVDRAPDGRLFVTSVREKGVPASLMTVSNETGLGGPLLAPYPNWSWYENTDDCNNKIISVYRVSIKCNHLFVLDCGKVGEVIKCPPKLLIFDLRNDMLVNYIIIPPHIANNKNGTGLLVTPLAYVLDCNKMNDMTVFMADIEGYGLAIYYEKIDKSYFSNQCFSRIESTFMKPTDPNFTIQNQSFYLEDGILGLTIIHKELFYSPLAGNNIYKMNRCKIQKCPKLNKNEADKLTQLAGTLAGQTGPIASEKCAIFFSNIPETSILCQDADKEFNSNNTELIAQDSEKLQFPSGLKVTNQGKILMALTNRFQRVMTNTLDTNETNFRILVMSIMQIRNEFANCFDSCSDDHDKPQSEHHKHWHGRHWHNRHWHDRRWYRGSWHRRRWYNNNLIHDKHDKYDNYDKDDKHNKYSEECF